MCVCVGYLWLSAVGGPGCRPLDTLSDTGFKYENDGRGRVNGWIRFSFNSRTGEISSPACIAPSYRGRALEGKFKEMEEG